MKKYVILLFLIGNVCFGQDYLLQEYIFGAEVDPYAKHNIGVDNDGNIYATGTCGGGFEIQDSVITSSGVYLAKFNQNLSLMWLKRAVRIVNPPGSHAALRVMITIDADGSPIIAYSSYSGVNNLQYDDSVNISTSNIELIKLDSDGNRLWRTAVTGSNRLGNKGIAVDGENNILITGKNENDDVFIAKYDENGNEIWYNTAGIADAGKVDEGTAITTDTNNNIYAAGKLYSNGVADTTYFGTYQIEFPVPCYDPTFLAKYLPDGTLQWVRYMYSSSPTISPIGYGSSTITTLKCFDNGNIVVGGFFTNAQLEFSDGIPSIAKIGNVGYRSSFLTCFDHSGNRLWAKTLHNTTTSGTHVADLAIDNNTSIYVLNESWGSVVNELGDTIPTNGGSSTDILLERYDVNGNLISSTGMGGNSHDFPHSIITYNHSVFTSSTTGGQGGTPFYIGSNEISINYLNNMILLKLIEDPALGVEASHSEVNVKLFPNPTISNVQITSHNSLKGKIVRVYNTLGEVVKTQVLEQEYSNEITLPQPSGVYFIRLDDQTIKIVKY